MQVKNLFVVRHQVTGQFIGYSDVRFVYNTSAAGLLVYPVVPEPVVEYKGYPFTFFRSKHDADLWVKELGLERTSIVSLRSEEALARAYQVFSEVTWKIHPLTDIVASAPAKRDYDQALILLDAIRVVVLLGETY